jgi:predicted nucleic acid-binding Zn ribbon protein
MRKRQPVSVSQAMGDLIRELGIGKTLSEYGVITRWSEVVGERIAAVARPERFERGVLFVSVSSAPWRAELTLRRQEIIDKINAAAGGTVVRDVRFR